MYLDITFFQVHQLPITYTIYIERVKKNNYFHCLYNILKPIKKCYYILTFFYYFRTTYD